MQDIALVIVFVGVLVFLAHFFTAIFSRTRVPDVLWLIIIGICLGPVLGLVTPDHFGAVGPILTTITLIIILFESGTALELVTLRSAVGGAMALATTSFFISMGAVAGIALWLTDLELIPAFILGAIVASISEAIVIPMVKQLRMRKDSQTMLSIESSVNDVLSIVITLALVEAYMLGEFQVAPVTGKLVASFLVGIVSGIVGAFIWSRFLNRIHAIKNTMFTTAAFVFVIYGLVQILGFNGLIAALAFGITIGNVESIRFYVFRRPQANEPVGLSQTERAFFSEVAFLLKTFFFVYLGISLELISGWLIQLAVILTVLVFILRIPAVKVTVKKSIPIKDASFMAIMVPKGLAAVVLASIPFQQGITGGELIQNVTYGIVLLSIVITSFLLLLLEKTKLSNIYGWILSPHKFSDFYSWLFLLPRPNVAEGYHQISSRYIANLPEKIKTLSSEAKVQVKAWFYDIGKPKETWGRARFEDKTRKTKR
ncbi:MAG: cation:proton antiporter [Dehalococcoidales bacterium]